MDGDEQLGFLSGDVYEPQPLLPGLPAQLPVVWHSVHVTIPQPCMPALPCVQSARGLQVGVLTACKWQAHQV